VDDVAIAGRDAGTGAGLDAQEMATVADAMTAAHRCAARSDGRCARAQLIGDTPFAFNARSGGVARRAAASS
jgi:hypothetical protein